MDQKEVFNKTAEEFHEKTKDLAKFTDEQRNDFLEHIPKGGKILDLACGPGRDAKIFTDLGYQVIGVDLAEKMIEIAREIAPKAEFKVMDMVELDFPDNFFDGVWFNAGILMVKKEEAPAVIQKIHQMLKPGGVLYINAKKGEGEGWGFDERYQIEKFRAYYEHDELKGFLTQFEILKSWSNKHSGSYNKRIWIEFLCKK